MADIVTGDEVGATISFESKNAKDSVVWRGVVRGIVDYNVARMHGDPTSYHGAVSQVDSELPSVENCSFFLFELNEAPTGTNKLRAFASEWISAGSLVIIADTVEVVLSVYDIDTNNHQAIVDVLKQNGYPNVFIRSVKE